MMRITRWKKTQIIHEVIQVALPVMTMMMTVMKRQVLYIVMLQGKERVPIHEFTTNFLSCIVVLNKI